MRYVTKTLQDEATHMMTATMSINDCFYPTDFFAVMESQRSDIPRMTRLKYGPIFIINTLRDKLESMELKHSSSEESVRKRPGEVSEKWTGDTLLEENSDYEGTYFIEDKVGKRYIKRLLTFACLLRDDEGRDGGLDPFDFLRLFCKEIEFPPLELVWLLNSKFNLLGINSYFMKLKSATQIEYLVGQFVSFCFSSSLFDNKTKKKGTKILQAFLHEIMIAAHCNSMSSEILIKVRSIAEDILIKITNRLLSPDPSSYMNRQFIIAMLQAVPIIDSVKKRYFAYHLNHILSTDKSQTTLQDILQHQEKFAKPVEMEDQGKADTITLFLGPPQTRNEVMETLNRSLKNMETLNWEALLLTITVWERSESQDSSQMMFSLLKEIIRDLMKTGLEEEDENKIMAAFILGRHCSLISPQNFSRYEKWYARMFESESSTPANTITTFQFLAKVLSTWVPFEPPCFLQVHATYWPYIPFGMRNCWNDYVSLSKVRIAEYTEVEQAMEFEPNPNNPVQYDVEMAIKSFESTKKLPNTILEMLMFRKQYYIDQFLPALLRKPHGVVLTDARLRLIEALNASGKIPLPLYSAYKASEK